MSATWKVTAKHTQSDLIWGAEAVVEEGVDISNPKSPPENEYEIQNVKTHETKRVFSHRSFDVGDLIEDAAWSREA